MSCTPEWLSYIHQKHEKPTTLVKKVMREFDRGTRGWFLRKVVLGQGGGGTLPHLVTYPPSSQRGGIRLRSPRCCALCLPHRSRRILGYVVRCQEFFRQVSAPWSRDPETLLRLKTKKTQKIHDFGHNKGGRGHFFDIFDPTPTTNPPPPSFKTSKKWVSSGGGGSRGGSRPKTHWGMCLLDKIMILQGVKQTIQPLEVGYATRPKQAQKGGHVAFSPIGPAWL